MFSGVPLFFLLIMCSFNHNNPLTIDTINENVFLFINLLKYVYIYVCVSVMMLLFHKCFKVLLNICFIYMHNRHIHVY